MLLFSNWDISKFNFIKIEKLTYNNLINIKTLIKLNIYIKQSFFIDTFLL